ncbi:MAG TPA: hypothetical protein DEH78_10955, partial [Solibacterales bacterium]|nr:hypothetical protein [Bryobacterales bacterium]
MLTESLALAALGGLLGLVAAKAFLHLILASGPPALVGAMPIALDGRALLFTAGGVLFTAVLAGLWPAWRAVSFNVRDGRGITRGHRGARAALAAAQVSIAAVLLIGSGLLLRSLLRVLEVDPGFDPRNLVSLSTQLPPELSGQQRTNAYEALRRALLAAPGVKSVSAVSRLPMLGSNLASQLHIEGRPHEGAPPEVEFRAAAPDYFATMGIPIRSGRVFAENDPPDQRVLVIDEALARRYFPGENPVGKRIRFAASQDGTWFTVAGVVGAIRHFGLEAEARPTIYRPAATNPLTAPILVIRVDGDAASLLPALTRIVRTAHGSLPAYNVLSLEELVSRSAAQRRFLASMLSVFAFAALFFACLGIYGTVAQSMAERTQEI